MLGMSVMATYRRDGAPFEYVMGLKAPGAILALPEALRPSGPNGFGRVTLETPAAKALGQLLAARGVPVREVVPGVAYFITDPEGTRSNSIRRRSRSDPRGAMCARTPTMPAAQSA